MASPTRDLGTTLTCQGTEKTHGKRMKEMFLVKQWNNGNVLELELWNNAVWGGGGGGWNNRMTFFLRYPSVLQVLTPGMSQIFLGKIIISYKKWFLV